MHKPRNDYVLVRKILRNLTPSGIAVPNKSAQGADYRIVAWGPDVKDLEVGQNVLMVGQVGLDYAYLPNSSDLCIIKQANIVLVYDEVEEKCSLLGRESI